MVCDFEDRRVLFWVVFDVLVVFFLSEVFGLCFEHCCCDCACFVVHFAVHYGDGGVAHWC